MIDPAQALSGFAVGAIVGLTDLLQAAITKTGGDRHHHPRRRTSVHGRRAGAALVPAPVVEEPAHREPPHPVFTVLTGVVLGFLVSVSSLLGSLRVGSLPGIYIGSQFVGRIPDTALRILLAVMLLVVGTRLISF
jgi:hypothetical protein